MIMHLETQCIRGVFLDFMSPEQGGERLILILKKTNKERKKTQKMCFVYVSATI